MSGDRLKNFGVSSLLSVRCKVYYSSLFTSTHLGRVSDLLAARMRSEFSDEVSLRAILLFQFFHAFYSFKDPNENDPWLSEPLVIECGFDDGKLAVGISLNFPPSKDAPTPQLLENAKSGDITNELEKLVSELSRHCSELIVRYQPESRRFEIVTIITSSFEGECQTQWVEVSEDSSTNTPASQYIELGDLNYAELLETKIKGAPTPKPTGEVLTKIAGNETEKDLLRVVKGGGQQAPDQSVTVFKTTTETQAPNEKVVIASTANADKVRELESTVKDLEQKLSRAIAKNAELAQENSEEYEYVEEDEEEEGESTRFVPGAAKKTVFGFFKKMFKPESEVDAEGAQEESELKETNSLESSPVSEGSEAQPGKDASKKDEPASPAASKTGEISSNPEAEKAPWSDLNDKKPEEPTEIASQLVTEIEKGKFNEALAKIQDEAGKDKSNKSGKSKIMIQGAMGELLAERSRLLDMAKKVSVQIKQKDLELKNKERSMQMELKRKDDLLKQKEYSLKRAKDQGAQIMKQLEAAKSSKGNAAAEAQYKLRVQQSNKLLQMQKEANQKLTQRIEDLQRQVNFANASHAGQTTNHGVAGQADLNAQLGKSNRQVDELRRTNRILMEQLHQAKAFATRSAPSDDATKKLQTAVKKIAEERKENEALKEKIRELEEALQKSKSQDPAA